MKFNDAQLRRLDITLLLVFEETMSTGKLSAAAKRLGLTQSAISHALKRLRNAFGDELFIRTPRGVTPTPRAMALREPVSEALRLIDTALRPARFDPDTDPRIFRIAASDYLASLVVPTLIRKSPGTARFIVRNLIRQDAIQALNVGDLDLLIGYTWDKDKSCQSVTLYHENYCVVARKNHPALKKALTLDAYAKYRHVLVSPGGTLSGIVDASLERVGATRQVVAALPYFLSALATVACTDLLATVPERVAREYAGNFGLGIAQPPVPIRSFPVQMIWSRRSTADPAMQWLRERVAEVAEGISLGQRS